MKIPPWSRAAACSGILVLGALLPAAHAVTLFEDSFADGDRTNGDDPLDGQWRFITNTAPANSTVVDGALTVGGTVSGSGNNPHLVTTFDPYALALGETISLSFDFRSTGAANATGIRFGLFNSGGTNLSADLVGVNPNPTGTTFQNDIGFSVFAPHQLTGDIGFYHRPANATANTVQLAVAANTLLAPGPLAVATNPTDLFSASLSLTRTAGGYDYAVSYAGSSFAGSTATTNGNFTFDSLAIFGIEGSGASLTIDNVVVTAVPEPGSLALLALGLGLGGVGLVRRRFGRHPAPRQPKTFQFPPPKTKPPEPP